MKMRIVKLTPEDFTEEPVEQNGRKLFKGKGTLKIPNGSTFMTVNVIKGKPFFWFAVPAEPYSLDPHTWELEFHATGLEIDASLLRGFIATCFDQGYVWHVFRKIA